MRLANKTKATPTRDIIERLNKQCKEYGCPEISIDKPTICKVNCPIVKECKDMFGVDLITI